MQENPCVSQIVYLMMMCAETVRVCVCSEKCNCLSVCLSAASLKSHTRVLSQQPLPMAKLSFHENKPQFLTTKVAKLIL